MAEKPNNEVGDSNEFAGTIPSSRQQGSPSKQVRGLWAFVDPGVLIKTIRPHIGRILSITALVTLLGLVLSLFGALDGLRRSYDDWFRYRGKQIVIVGNSITSEDATWDQVEAGIKAALKHSKHPILRRGSQFQVGDNKDPNDLCNDSSVILAVGYLTSSLAERAISELGKCGAGKLPMIIIGATKTTLTDVNDGGYKTPILRLPPSNRREAKKIVAGLHDTFGSNGIGGRRPKIRVILGVQNRSYADDLFEGFKQAVIFTRQNWEIDHVVAIDSQYLSTVAQEAFIDSQVNAVVFLGMTEEAAVVFHARKMALAKLRATPDTLSWAKNQVLIVSDGSTNRTMTENADGECVWGLFPFGEVRGTEIANRLGLKVPPASYMAYGADAILIADAILQRSDSWWRGPTRASIGEAMSEAALTKETFPGLLGLYSFNKKGGLQFFFNDNRYQDGEVEDLYHLLQLRRMPGDTKLEWFHRECDTSLLQCTADVGCAPRSSTSQEATSDAISSR